MPDARTTNAHPLNSQVRVIMKKTAYGLLTITLSIVLLSGDIMARGPRGGGGGGRGGGGARSGGGGRSMPNRSASRPSTPSRSPSMSRPSTPSRPSGGSSLKPSQSPGFSRPSSRPSTQPSRPGSQPSRPSTQPSRPGSQPSRPSTQPSRPGSQPSLRPGSEHPAGRSTTEPIVNTGLSAESANRRAAALYRAVAVQQANPRSAITTARRRKSSGAGARQPPG